jgi:gamma-glutamyltranspeptidase/glutathione hydrolase
VVATSQPLAAAAGLDALRRGGNAVDAAVAAAITLTVVQPGSNDIGGDLFAIVWDGQRLHGLNASGRSPAGLTRSVAMEAAPPTGHMPDRGWPSVTVPGAPAGWRDLHARFGRLRFAELFDDAIVHAERGIPVSQTVAHHWQRALAIHAGLHGPEFAAWPGVFAPGGRAPLAGEWWRNQDAARTLRLIAATQADAFYAGEIAESVVRLAVRTGGTVSRDDLASHRSLWVEPVHAAYRGHEVWELPPNGQGIAALLAMSILDGLDLAGAAVEERVHVQVEAMKLGFADAHAFVADPDDVPVAVADLLSTSYVESRRQLVGGAAASPVCGAPERGGTVYLCSADADGMMVSLIQSNYMGFGSFIVVPGYGFGLQNRAAGFVLDREHPNVVAPHKRPYHTIIPGFLTRGGEPVGPFGVMGGHMQPQGHVQLITSTVDAKLDPQAALGAPRWYWESRLRLLVEPEYGAGVVAALCGRGHDASLTADRTVFGNGQAIWRLPGGRGYVAGSEPRADGLAAAY